VRKMHLFRNYLFSSQAINSYENDQCQCNSTEIIICDLEGNSWETDRGFCTNI